MKLFLPDTEGIIRFSCVQYLETQKRYIKIRSLNLSSNPETVEVAPVSSLERPMPALFGATYR